MACRYSGLSAVLLLGLSGCGGGGGSDSTPAPTYTVQVGSFTGGSISPTSVNVSQGQTATFTVTADTGFELVSVTGCGGSLTGSTYRTGPITAACSIAATFNKKNYTVNATASNGGSINPTTVSVAHGDTASFDVAANSGFKLDSVSGCGGTLAGNSYTTAAVTAACEVNASFSALTFNVNAIAEGNGSISPSQQVASYNEQLTFTLAPAAGHAVTTITGCDGSLQGLTYVTAPITAACTINASFGPASYTLRAAAVGGGEITPTVATVASGGQVEFTLQPNNGFRFRQLDGCEGRFADNKYIVENITQDCTIVARFNSADVVEFADDQLARAVKSALGIALTEPVPATRLAQLTTLTATGLAVSRLDGLQYASALEYLDLGNNNITNFSILNFLAAEQQTPKLRSLYIGNNPASHLPGFARFSALRNLSLQGLELSQLPNLASLVQLDYLNLAYNSISDMSSLAGLRLSSLYLNGNPLPDSNFRVLSGMPLRSLHVDHTGFSSAEQINMLDNLWDFSANYTPLSNLNPLMGLRNLRTLSLYGSQVVDLSPLLNMFPNNNAGIYLGGCLKTRGFARAPAIIEQLQGRGNFVQVYDWAFPYGTGCNAGLELIKDFTVTADLTNNGLRLDWSVNSTDLGPWRCELHTNLAQQQARAPVKVLEDCHLTRSWQITDFPTDVAEAHLLIDTGLVRTKVRADAGRVVNRQGLADPYLDSIDWLQVVAKTNPYLVPYRQAKMRLHLLSAANQAPPLVEAWLQEGGSRQALTVTPPLRLPAVKNVENLQESYLVNLPAALAKPGIKLVVKVAGQTERVFTPQFAEVNSMDITIVPFKLGDTVATLPSNELIENSILTVWPFASVKVTNRQPYTLSAAANLNNNSSMLSELYDLRIAEGGSSYYYGYYTREMNNDGWGGMAYRPGTSGVGLVPFGEIDFTLSHELGHNLSIQHAPCGNPSGVDTNYPYANASIGTYGVPLSFNTLLSPTVYKDLMSYCGSEHVSDYNFELAQDYITEQQNSGALHLRANVAADEPMMATSASLPRQPALFYRFELKDAAAPTILQAMKIAQLPLVKADSRFSVLAEFNQGVPLLVPVEKLVFGHGEAAEQISFAVPLTHRGAALVSWSLYDGQRLLHLEPFATPATSVGTLAAAGVRVEESATEVCVSVLGQADAVNLTLVQPDKTTVVALNERSAKFCRPVEGLPGGGLWQVQSRKGASVQLFEHDR